ncbi:Toxoplasma gondii family A protein [Besnoitia besnoiti]|uniref:Toxoplasma gondii family A protein n=1 Tax=Besnoitia besnoiti TaxID=94643 RepID=A0A2A9MFN7_BESBE|nr:Toxoplasma gondii family A protein [Besnoitia besnoiti]PFH36739.1 Toxoplasma gondii family A protein [Besnoitia besnoiti]
MVAALIRAFSWALAVSVVLYCTAAEAGEPAAEPDFIFTIPKGGMEAEEQKVVWLGPSKALRVVDSTDAAVFLPQPGNSPSAAPSSEQMNAVAYVFANGACDFTKQVEYKELFPEYNKPVWDRSPPAEATVEGDSSPSLGANYTFTSPPAEALGKVASFCVRFMVEKPVKSEAGTQEGQEGPNRNSGGPPPGTSEEGGT